MPHWPSLPPDWEYDIAPGNPFEGEPPLPAFLRYSTSTKPWLEPKLREELEEKYGYYVTRRSEAMVGPKDGPELVKKVATEMHRRWLSGYGIKVAPPKVLRVVKPRVPKVAPADVATDVKTWIGTEYTATGKFPTIGEVISEVKREYKVEISRDLAEEWIKEVEELAREV